MQKFRHIIVCAKQILAFIVSDLSLHLRWRLSLRIVWSTCISNE